MSDAPDAGVVRALLEGAGEEVGGELEIEPLPGGASRDLWLVRALGRRWVLRRDPPGERARTSREEELRLQRAAYEAGMAVPRPVAFGEVGTPAMLMEHVAGEALPRRVLRSPPPGLARQLGSALAALRGVDVQALAPEVGAEPCARALAGVRADLDATGAALPALELALRWLALRHPGEPERVGVVHGDFRLGNFVVGDEGLRAVLDWEFWHPGDPVEDLAWVCARPWRFGRDDLPVAGVGTLAELLEGFAEPVDPERLRWWGVMSQVKWGVYCVRQAAARARGDHRSLERTVLGRRVAEAEWDALELVA